MNRQWRDPFEVAYEEDNTLEQDSPIESPVAAVATANDDHDNDDGDDDIVSATDDGKKNKQSVSTPTTTTTTTTANASEKNKEDEDEDEEEEDNMEMDVGKFTAGGDPDKMAKMQAILSQFTEEQMSRYESFRRSGFQKGNMKKLLASLTGNPKISQPVNIVVSGIAKMFVGDLVETARMVMNERNESGPIRPCHIRESYRRLKLEGKLPKQSVPRLFR